MNKFNFSIGLIFSFALITPCSATAPRMSAAKLASETLPHIVSYEYPPLVIDDRAKPGVAVEIATQAFAVGGKPLTIENFPSKMLALQLLTQDSMVVAFLGEARSLSATDRKSLSEEKILNLTGKYFFYKPSGQDLSNTTDLKALKGLTYGTIAEEATEIQNQAGIKVITDEPKLLLRKLQSKEIDFISAFPPNGEWLITRLFPEEKDHFADMPLKAWESSFSLWFNNNKASKDWQTAFSEGFKKIKQNGVYKEILKKYGLESAAVK